MTEQEILVQAVDKYIKGVASKLFNINSIAGQAVITYAVNNMYNKYSMYVDPFVDKDGKINLTLLGNAVKEELKNRNKDGIVFNIFGKNIKFGEADINELIKIFTELNQPK